MNTAETGGMLKIVAVFGDGPSAIASGGSAFGIDPGLFSNTFVTAEHALVREGKAASAVYYEDDGGKLIPVHSWAVNVPPADFGQSGNTISRLLAGKDVGVLTLDQPFVNLISPELSATFTSGVVKTSGFPRGAYLEQSVTARAGSFNTIDLIGGVFWEGNSGGKVQNSAGQIVGVMSAGNSLGASSNAVAAKMSPSLVDQLVKVATSDNQLMTEKVNNAIIYALYDGILGRDPESGGLGFWNGELNTGEPLKNVILSFVSSDEFRLQHGTLDDRAFVRQIYLDALKREPDPPGWDYWTGTTDLLGRDVTVTGIVLSPEHMIQLGY